MSIILDELKEQLRCLLAIASPTGCTGEVVQYLRKTLQSMGVEVRPTRKGGVLAYLPGQGMTVLAGSHVDTLGAMVREIQPDGTLAIARIGGYMMQSVEGENCSVLTRQGSHFGGTLFTTEPSVHIYDEPGKLERKAENYRLLLDERVSTVEGVRELGIQVGDFISFDPRTVFTASGYIKSRHLDDKAGTACLLSVIRALLENKRHQPVYFYFTIYEEVGHGASASIPPEVEEMVSVDIGLVGRGQASQETSVTICAKDSFSPYDYELTTALWRIAQEKNIPHCLDLFPHYGSDADKALSAGHDFRAGLIGPGVFATHFYERTHELGLLATSQLLLEYLKRETVA